MSELIARIKRGFKKPPKVILKRLIQECHVYINRYHAPQRAKVFNIKRLLKKISCNSLDDLWNSLSKKAYVSYFLITPPGCHSSLSSDNSCDHLPYMTSFALETFNAYCPGEKEIIFEKAQLALKHQVKLLGSALISLGDSIDWHMDYKTGFSWPIKYMKDIDYTNPERPSDVKFPWEISRMQWLIPVGQAYLMTGNEKYAYAVKNVLLDWIEKNPYAQGINWACTMEVALRILTWTWFFHVFSQSKSWQDNSFQARFLTTLYLHAEFTEKHLEFSDINGNHYTADAAGLVFAGLFFGDNPIAKHWHQKGWAILCDEIQKQVFEDGVDFEASVPYHRLVLELFFLPARFRESLGFATPRGYQQRLISMANFSAAYTQPDGSIPFWGDADDARALPFGYQPLNYHLYLCSLVGYQWNVESLMAIRTLSYGELFWLFGPETVTKVQKSKSPPFIKSTAFTDGGFYIMRNSLDHVFIDCGPIGLGGRGGHGHNDCLSFEAVLNGVKLITDCGAYVYTASYQERNLFRSTTSHNTPCVDEQEINQFIRWDYLWTMHNQAHPKVEAWLPGDTEDYFCGSHIGYQRLADPVTPKRTIRLEHKNHRLVIQDKIICKLRHNLSIPLHLAIGVKVIFEGTNNLTLEAEQKQFQLKWISDSDWQVDYIDAFVSPSYGIKIPTKKLVWSAVIEGNSSLSIEILPKQ